MIIRQAQEQDSEKLARLIREVESTSDFMLLGPGERVFNPDAQRKMIKAFYAEHNSNIFLAVSEDEIAGYLIARGGSADKNRHSAYIVIGILEDYRGKGVGTKLFAELFDWASAAGLHRLELTVIKENQAAVGLYRKMGFEIEGTKKDSLFFGGKFMDEYYMSKIV